MKKGVVSIVGMIIIVVCLLVIWKISSPSRDGSVVLVGEGIWSDGSPVLWIKDARYSISDRKIFVQVHNEEPGVIAVETISSNGPFTEAIQGDWISNNVYRVIVPCEYISAENSFEISFNGKRLGEWRIDKP